MRCYVETFYYFTRSAGSSAKVDVTVASLNWISPGNARAVSLVASPLRHTIFARLLRQTYISLCTETLHLEDDRFSFLQAYVPWLYHRVMLQRIAEHEMTRDCRTTRHSPLEFIILKKEPLKRTSLARNTPAR